ncbi:MAG: hypothetical protein AAF628_19760 [Planctomycetota bacterium]
MAPRIVNLNIPKGGTWLLGRCIELLTSCRPSLPRLVREGILAAGEEPLWMLPLARFEQCLPCAPDEYLVGRVPYHPDWERALIRAGYRGIFIVRDPRDLAVSRLHWVRKHPEAWPEARELTDRQLLLAILDASTLDAMGSKLTRVFAGREVATRFCVPGAAMTLGRVYRAYLPWMDSPLCETVRFEDLVGAAGGGSETAQHAAIQRVAQQAGVTLEPARIGAVAQRLFGSGSSYMNTFRRGHIGRWRDYFEPEHEERLRAVAGDVLERLDSHATGVRASAL